MMTQGSGDLGTIIVVPRETSLIAAANRYESRVSGN